MRFIENFGAFLLLCLYPLSITIGILALQGNFAEHRTVLEALGANVVEVRVPKDLESVDALVIPGGESTVMMKFLKESDLDRVIIKRVEGGMPIFGTCAGAIMLSDSHLKLMDISVDRNAYGSQVDSFEATLSVEGIGEMQTVFIRAPKIIRTGPSVEVLAMHNSLPVVVRQRNVLAATCHPEMCGEKGLHRLFLGFLST